MRDFICDHITHWLYDTSWLGREGASMFIHERGRRDSVSVFGAGPKTIADTNMDLPSQIPPGWRMRLTTILFEPVYPTKPWAETLQEIQGMTLTLVIGSKQYVQVPASWALVPPGSNPHDKGYRFDQALVLVPSEPFYVLVTAPVSRDERRVRVALGDLLMRPTQ